MVGPGRKSDLSRVQSISWGQGRVARAGEGLGVPQLTLVSSGSWSDAQAQLPPQLTAQCPGEPSTALIPGAQ